MSGRRHPHPPLEDRLGHRFARPELLEQALTHSSTARGGESRLLSNERLEFLGDRVLGLIVADMLLAAFPREDEGSLSRRHAALVRRETLARVALAEGLDAELHLSRGEAESGGRRNEGLLADCCEAVIAALYLDGGTAAADAFVRPRWEPLMHELSGPPKDNKTALQEWAQGRGLPLPDYNEVGREGPPHAPVFTVAVEVATGADGRTAAEARGSSKRAAEQAAAGALLARLDPGGDQA